MDNGHIGAFDGHYSMRKMVLIGHQMLGHTIWTVNNQPPRPTRIPAFACL